MREDKWMVALIAVVILAMPFIIWAYIEAEHEQENWCTASQA
jgi:hypothetical protein